MENLWYTIYKLGGNTMSDKCNLYKKIHQVMDAVQYLEKDSKISFGNTNYRALSEEKVTTTVREKLIEFKLIIIPVEQSIDRENILTTVNTKYKIIDTETGESEIISSSGQGSDTQDKGAGKAMTYGYKYLLLRTFAIPTGEDSDKISSNEMDEKQQKHETNIRKFSDEQKKRIAKIKSIFNIDKTEGLNKYVEFWAKKKKKTVKTYMDLTTENIEEFCKYIEEHGNEVIPSFS